MDIIDDKYFHILSHQNPIKIRFDKQPRQKKMSLNIKKFHIPYPLQTPNWIVCCIDPITTYKENMRSCNEVFWIPKRIKEDGIGLEYYLCEELEYDLVNSFNEINIHFKDEYGELIKFSENNKYYLCIHTDYELP